MRTLLKIAPFLLFLFACEKEIELDIPAAKEYLVVEGHVEQDLPPYVILTRSLPFFESISPQELGQIFVHDAIINVYDGTDTVQLVEFYIDSIPDTLLTLIGEIQNSPIPLDSDELQDIGFSFYSTTEMLGTVGRGYSLEVLAEGKRLTSYTTIPTPRPLDSLWMTPHPNPDNDTLVTLNVRYTDEPGVRNYVRYITQRDQELPYPPLIQSVYDDFTIFNIDGETIDIPLERGQSQYGDIEFETYSYFEVGDTVTLKWCSIDKAHYDFWLTMEFDRNQTGNPFGRPTKVLTNINGGLGVWGGYGASYQQIIAE